MEKSNRRKQKNLVRFHHQKSWPRKKVRCMQSVMWTLFLARKPNAFFNVETRPHFIRFVDADSSKVWLFLGEACLFLRTLILTNSMHDCSNLTKTNPDLSQLLDTMLIIDLVRHMSVHLSFQFLYCNSCSWNIYINLVTTVVKVHFFISGSLLVPFHAWYLKGK